MLYPVASRVTQAFAPQQTYFHPLRFNLLTVAGPGAYLFVRGLFAYGVRQNLLWVKVLLALGFAGSLYANTHWRAGVVAGVAFGHLNLGSLLVLLQNLLTVAALAVMPWPPRVASPGAA